MRKSLLVALGAWFVVVSLAVLGSTGGAQRRLDRTLRAMDRDCSGKPLKRARVVRRSIEASRVVGFVSLFAAVLAVAVAGWLVCAPPNGQVALTLGATEATVACRRARRGGGDAKKKSLKNTWLCATVIAAACVVEAALLVGLVASLGDGRYYKRRCSYWTYGSNNSVVVKYHYYTTKKIRLNFRGIRKAYLPFGVPALVLSTFLFLFFASKLFRDHCGVSVGHWLLDKCHVLGGVLDAAV